MILAGSTQSLEIDLNGAVAANQCVYVAQYYDDRPADRGVARKSGSGVTNNTTAVTCVAAPAANDVRVVEYISVYNADIGALRIFVQLNDNGTVRILCDFTLTTLQRLEYVRGVGFQCFSATGAKL